MGGPRQSEASEVETWILAEPVGRRGAHVYGAAPPGTVMVALLVGVPVAFWLFVQGHELAGALFVVAALALLLLFASELRGRARVGWVAVEAWLHAGLRAVRLRTARRRLQRHLEELTWELGTAAYRGDGPLVESVNAHAHETARLIAETDDERRLAFRDAQARIVAARRTAAHT